MEARNMHIETPEPLMNRRELIWGAGMLAALGTSQAHAGAHSGGGRKVLTPAQQQALEEANEALVNNFIRDYARRDVNILAGYLADDIVYQVSETQGEVHGIEAYKKRIANSFAGLEKVDWQVLRSFAIGQLVINDRIDEFFPSWWTTRSGSGATSATPAQNNWSSRRQKPDQQKRRLQHGA
jgi:hypothetical protein